MKRRHPKGFSLIEALIALVVMALCVIPLTFLMTKTVRAPQESWEQTMAVLKAQELMDQIRATPWADLGGWNGHTDVSDSFTRRVTVRFVALEDVAGVWTIGHSLNPTRTRQVIIRVTGLGVKNKTLTTLYTNTE